MKPIVKLSFIAAVTVVFAFASAGPVTAATIWQENFEGFNEGDWLVGHPGAASWSSVEPDALVITNYTYAPEPVAGYPIPGNHTKVMRLTADATNTISTGVEDHVWLDFLVNPHRWDGDSEPANLPSDTQMAFYLNEDGFLTLYHADNAIDSGFPNIDPNNPGVWSSVEDPVFYVESNTWLRVSVHLNYGIDDGMSKYFQILLDGKLVRHAEAHYDPLSEDYYRKDDQGWDDGELGSWFPMATGATTETMSALELRGTGMFDDFVIGSDEPSINTVHTLNALGNPPQGGTITAVGNTIDDMGNVKVVEGSDLEFTWAAAEGYDLGGATVVDSGVTIPLAAEVTNYLFSAISSNGSLTVYFDYLGGDNPGLAQWLDETGIDFNNMTEETWKAYISSTDPDGGVFEIQEIWRTGPVDASTNNIKWFSLYVDTNLPPFTILRSTNLMSTFSPHGYKDRQAADVPGGLVTNFWSEPEPLFPVYYRIVATNYPAE